MFFHLPPPPPPSSSGHQFEFFMYSDFQTPILIMHSLKFTMKWENRHTSEIIELLNYYKRVLISPHIQGQIFKELNIKTPHNSGKHIHGPHIFHKKTVSISCLPFISPTIFPTTHASVFYLSSSLTNIYIQQLPVSLMKIKMKV